MNEIVVYNVSFMGLYWVLSLYICVIGGYSLLSRRLWSEWWKGTKSLAMQLPMSNIAMAVFAPQWADVQSFEACVAYMMCFDFLVYWYHTVFHSFSVLYKAIHKEHHQTHYVCPFSATTLSMSEHLIIGILPTLLPLYLIPMTEGGWAIMNAIFFMHGLFIHSNVRSPMERLGFIGTRAHATHHVRPRTHMGFLIPWFGVDPFHASSDDLNSDIIRYYSN